MASEKYKLVYFNARGRGELIRLLFVYSKVEYEDARFPIEIWSEVKHTLPLCKCPVLYVNDKPIADSGSAARYLARKFGLAGKNELEIAQADAIFEAVRDLAVYISQFAVPEKDPTKKAEQIQVFYTEKIPPFLDILEKQLKANGGTYFVGNQYTYADLAVVDGLDELSMFTPDPAFMDKHKLLKALVERVQAIPSIKKWRETRPQVLF